MSTRLQNGFKKDGEQKYRVLTLPIFIVSDAYFYLIFENWLRFLLIEILEGLSLRRKQVLIFAPDI